MRFIVSVNRSTSDDDIARWTAAGAGEFYFGYMPGSWVGKFGWEVCTNRRPYPQGPHLKDMAQVRRIIRSVHRRGARIFCAVNEHSYPLELARKVVTMSRAMERAGVDALVAADPALLMLLKESRVQLPVHASIGLGVQNAEAVAFFRRLGVSRFVLPRKLRPDEIVALIRSTPSDVEYEVFLLGEWCFYNDQMCFCPHGYGRDEFCRRQKGASGGRPHSMLHEPYEHAWCGLCLVKALERYPDRVIFKVPVRSDVFCSGVTIERVLKMSGRSRPSRSALIRQMKCRRRHCAYEFA